MSFTDTLKRSLGFEETESSNKNSDEPNFSDAIRGFTDDLKVGINSLRERVQENSQQSRSPKAYDYNPTQPQSYNPIPEEMPRPTPIYDDYDDFVIIPEQSYYEIVLIRPKSIDDVNYVVDQVVEERNPVIIDLSFLEKESPANFKLAGEKIKQMRSRYGAQALLLARSEEKNLIIISPKKVKLINKK